MSYLTPDNASATPTTGTPATTPAKRIRVPHLLRAKQDGRKLTMLTAYDALTAPLLEAAGVDMLLIGDSVGNVMLGYDSTLPVTLADIERATQAVARSTHRPLIVADMPFGTYEDSSTRAFEAATTLMRAGAHAVKLEGGHARAHTIRLLTDAGIPVVGHLGYTPQSEHLLGGPRMQGRGQDGEAALLADARALEEAGVIALVLEMVPAPIAGRISHALTIPTIGIGAGPDTDGQVLVWSDMAGMTEWTPSFVRRFAELGAELRSAAEDYVKAVRDGSFPRPGNFRDA